MDNVLIPFTYFSLLFAVLIYLFAQKQIIKYTPPLLVFKYIILAALFITIIVSTLIFALIWLFVSLSLGITVSIFVFLILLAAFTLYTLTIYSYAESSITMKLLSIISEKEKGVSITEIKIKYNKDYIVQRRLDRLKKQRVLNEYEHKLHLTQVPFLFRIRRLLLKIICLLFPE